MVRRCRRAPSRLCKEGGAGPCHQNFQRSGMEPRKALRMEESESRKTRESLYLRVPYRHEQRKRKGRHGTAAGSGSRLRHLADNGSSRASLLRLLRLSGKQFLRPELPFRNPRRIQGLGGRCTWKGYSGDNGYSALACGFQRNRGARPL